MTERILALKRIINCVANLHTELWRLVSILVLILICTKAKLNSIVMVLSEGLCTVSVHRIFLLEGLGDPSRSLIDLRLCLLVFLCDELLKCTLSIQLSLLCIYMLGIEVSNLLG